MIEQLKDVLSGLALLKESSNSTRIEFSIVHIALKRLEWAELSTKAKQDRRKSMLQAIKKYREEDGLQSYDYENAVVAFYDLGMLLLRKINMQESNCLSIKRLKVLLLLDLEELDRFYSLREKKLIPPEVYTNLQSDLLKEGISFVELDEIISCLKIISSLSAG